MTGSACWLALAKPSGGTFYYRAGGFFLSSFKRGVAPSRARREVGGFEKWVLFEAFFGIDFCIDFGVDLDPILGQNLDQKLIIFLYILR